MCSRRRPALLVCLLSCLLACGEARTPGAPIVPGRFELTSPAFAAGGAIPEKYTCAGDGVPPPLAWSPPPPGTRSLALVFEKQAAGTQPGTARDTVRATVLWVLYNLSPAATELPEGARVPSGGTVHGTNTFGTRGYDGPCPAGEGDGRYVFRLHALDVMLPAEAGETDRRLAGALAPHVLAVAELAGTYTYGAE